MNVWPRGPTGAVGTEGETMAWCGHPGGGVGISGSEEAELCHMRQQMCSKV